MSCLTLKIGHRIFGGKADLKRKSSKKNKHIKRSNQVINLGKEWHHLSSKQREFIVTETYNFYDKLSPADFPNDKDRRRSAIVASYNSFSDKGGWCNWKSFYLKLNSKIIRRNNRITLAEKRLKSKENLERGLKSLERIEK